MGFLAVSLAAARIEGGNHRHTIGLRGDDEQKLFEAAVAGGFEASGVGALDAHSVVAVGTGHVHGAALSATIRSTQSSRSWGLRASAGGAASSGWTSEPTTSRLTPLLADAAGEIEMK